MDPNRREHLVESQRRLKETFLDLANTFTELRMQFLRQRGRQPPEQRPDPKRPL